MRVCTPCSTVLGGHQLGWSLGNEFSGERFGTSACLSERSRLAQKGPRFKSFFSDTFFFQEKKTGKKIWWSMCSPFVSVQLQRHVQARVMSLPLMEQLKARFALQEMFDVEGSIWVRNSGHSIPNYPFGVNFEGFPLFFCAIFGLEWPYENTMNRTYRLFDRFISLHSFEAWHWGIIQLHQFFVWLTSVEVQFFFGTWSRLIVSSLISPKTIWSWVPAKRKESIQRSKSGHDNQLHHVMLWQFLYEKKYVQLNPTLYSIYISIHTHTLFRHPSRL